jgi:hypothetical protein
MIPEGLEGDWGMYRRGICAGLVTSFSIALAATVSAQQGQNLSPEDQLAPTQKTQPMPGRASNPPGGQASTSAAPHAPKPAVAAVAGASSKPAAGAALKAVACSGAFSKDSSNLKLAIMFDQNNVSYGDISVNGSSVGASTVYPKDPKRRIEVWWQNPANRSGIYLILINGQSTWAAPGGMKLGQTLADLEKLNKKPFKLKGFDKDNNATVTDWDGGALATLTGGCKSGVTLQPDSKASSESVSALPADKEFSSNDPAMRDVKPKVSEILIGY